MEKSYLIKPLLDEDYPIIDYGQGVYLYDINGKEYLDGCSGAVTANIGHGVREVIDAMQEQSKKVSFVYRSQFTSYAAENLAKEMASLFPGDLKWTFFVNSGSEATETAMKIAIQHWQEKGITTKQKILSRWVSYHGITLGALSMSGNPVRRMRFVPILHDYPLLQPPYCYRCPFNKEPESCYYECAQELETMIGRIGADHIAAFIAEPIVGASGAAITPPIEYYKMIRDICDRHNILFIADEVMTGFGRTGKMLALEHWNVTPDIVALGKGMGAGYTPIAATLVSERIMEPMLNGSKLIMSGHTLSANPQSCAVSLAVIHYLKKNKVIEQVEEKSNYLFQSLKKLQQQFSFIGDVRGKGFLIGMEFVQDKQTKTPFPINFLFTTKLVKLAQENGLLIYPSQAGLDGKSGNAILVAPPLTITIGEIDKLISLLTTILTKMESIINDGS